jgi:hypothetical protein
VVDFGDGRRLYVTPLMRGTPPATEVDYPRDPKEARLVTTALEYGVGGFSVFLIAAQRETPSIEEVDGGWRVRGEGFDVSLGRGAGREIAIRENASGTRRTLQDPLKNGRR